MCSGVNALQRFISWRVEHAGFFEGDKSALHKQEAQMMSHSISVDHCVLARQCVQCIPHNCRLPVARELHAAVRLQVDGSKDR